ncbi:MAG: biotin/lipoyl-binding protein [Bdellovibrionales bacterium]|nr:biotin/lipoyl-binding protein [Bdellovibrionales bacterium]MBT3526285.1 biotin/lipoyl-binding protein [Bdellovibrionales bacterium]MBT7670194.1 biotin/lipoyl-binding protein [Bdellovibrionales bacterium]MBT7765874.1 biotin/lipoyl-binding protein [Bdellovibrionales bacterium]
MDQERISFLLDGDQFSFEIVKSTPTGLELKSGNQNLKAAMTRTSAGITNVVIGGCDIEVEEVSGQRRRNSQGGAGEMRSPMPGWVLKVLVKEGDQVKEGETLLVLEAMKMEHAIKAAIDGTVAVVHASVGDMVEGGVELIGLTPLE